MLRNWKIAQANVFNEIKPPKTFTIFAQKKMKQTINVSENKHRIVTNDAITDKGDKWCKFSACARGVNDWRGECKKMTTRRRTSLPAVCCCLPSDKSEASGETRRAGTWRWWRRRGDGRRSHSLCVIWGNLQINTTAWCSEPLSSPTSPHCISPSLPSPPLPPFSQPSWLHLPQASFISLWLHFWGMHRRELPVTTITRKVEDRCEKQL